jgi:hypothetical protein
MKGRTAIRLLSVVVLGALFGLGLSAAIADEPVPVPQPAIAVPQAPVPAAPTTETCLGSEDPFAGRSVSMCSGCSFFPPDWCTDNCCGSFGACIDDWSGGYCVC